MQAPSPDVPHNEKPVSSDTGIVLLASSPPGLQPDGQGFDTAKALLCSGLFGSLGLDFGGRGLFSFVAFDA